MPRGMTDKYKFSAALIAFNRYLIKRDEERGKPDPQYLDWKREQSYWKKANSSKWLQANFWDHFNKGDNWASGDYDIVPISSTLGVRLKHSELVWWNRYFRAKVMTPILNYQDHLRPRDDAMFAPSSKASPEVRRYLHPWLNPRQAEHTAELEQWRKSVRDRLAAGLFMLFIRHFMGVEAAQALKTIYSEVGLKWRPLRIDNGLKLEGSNLKTFRMRLRGYGLATKQGDIGVKNPKVDASA